jgi:hypothetical protein
MRDEGSRMKDEVTAESRTRDSGLNVISRPMAGEKSVDAKDAK